MNNPKRIYLAGKIGKNDWRSSIVKDLKNWRKQSASMTVWPELERSIFNRFTYVGPFYIDPNTNNIEHGPEGESMRIDGHGYPHAWKFGGKHGGDDCYGRGQIVEQCLMAINRADIVFAWIDSADAYGTFVELGYASGLGAGRAEGEMFGPEIYIANPSGFDLHGDIWFPLNMADCGGGEFESPAVALRQCMVEAGYFFDSPLERSFYNAWRHHSWTLPLEIQHEVMNGRYRLDFAHLPTKTAIEVDGFAYHGDRRQFERDRKRDRELAEVGWKTIRFASQELTKNIDKCAEQAARMIRAAEQA